MKMDDQIENERFQPPPEAPTFRPTPAEFADPIAYIASKVRPTLEKTGICKIKPPQDWQPPFAVDVENFKFVPRVQKINELEATTRVKLIFLNKLMKFWDLQGVALKVPTVNRKPLDFHKLHKIVQEEGGYEHVTQFSKWKHVATIRMNLPIVSNNNKCYGMVLKGHYEKHLYPYDLCELGISSNPAAQRLLSKQAAAARKSPKKEIDVDYSINSEMKKLQFFGAGKKAAIPVIKQEGKDGYKASEVVTQSGSSAPRRAMRDRSKASYLENDICRLCTSTDNEEDMLTCSHCDEVYHRYCLLPKVTGVIHGDWRCPRCVAKEYKKPTEVFGFEQSTKQYSLASFGAMADQFKENYFQKSIEKVSCAEVEREFWRLTKSINEDVTVQYGADIHALSNGSGFPTEPNSELTEEDEKYVYSKWNLNNLPVHDQSVLKYVSGDVSGMKVPWCYVGMCFSSFCWHIEDHWSYSINYHHWGEPKTWYGVPSSHAEDLEAVMKSRAPELFEQSPDLLHHITTIMNPNSLMSHNIPVVRTDQCAGEFIITAPRAFHAGFNQGYNFAEAVNFCPADWLPMGRACISNYKKVKRYCVFSHEELVCKMAADAESLDLVVAMEAHKELLAIVDQERKLRKKLLTHGVKKAERETFELLQDDERQCCYCKTTCFLSAITCPCRPNKLACIEHITQMCRCPGVGKCLRYRYTLDELPAMIRSLGGRVEGYQLWMQNTRAVFSAKGDSRVSFNELKQLHSEAKENHYPDNPMFKGIQRAVKDAEKYSCLVKEVVNRKARSRRHTELAIKSAARRLTVPELENIVTQLSELPCSIRDSDLLEDLASKATQFQSDVRSVLAVEPLQREKLEKLYEVGVNLDFDMDEMNDLEHAMEQTKWIDEVSDSLNKAGDDDDLVTVEELKSLVRRGHALPVHADVDKNLQQLEDLLKISQSWEEKASICLQAQPKHTLSTIEAILSECDDIKVYLPNIELLGEAVEKSQEWKEKAERALKSIPHPTLEQLRNILTKSKALPIKLDLADDVNSIITRSQDWKSEACDHFLKEDSDSSLLDTLLPKHSTKSPTPRKRHQQNRRSAKQQQREGNISNRPPTDKLIDSKFSTDDMYEKSALSEIESMKELRLVNADCPRFCQCGADPTGSMFKCELCKEWLHKRCRSTESHSTRRSLVSEEMRLLCPHCIRSKRPTLDIILKLLVSLQKIPARLLEGEALQCLTERTIKWQEGAKAFLNSQHYKLLARKFDGIQAKNDYWKKRSAQQAEFEEITPDVVEDHDYISPSRTVKVIKKVVPPNFDIPDVEPDEHIDSQLDSLMVEGYLLEVTLAELSELWKFSKTLSLYKINKLEPPPQKAVLSSRDTNSRNKGKTPDSEPTQEDVISSTTSHGAEKPTKRARKKKSWGHTAKKKKREVKPVLVEMDDDEEDDEWGDYDERCAASDGCLLPDDESIGWVQCERCELWLHFVCIGEDPAQLANTDYICVACKSATSEDGESSHDDDVMKPTDILISGDSEPELVEEVVLPSDYLSSWAGSPSDTSMESYSSQSEMSSASIQRFKPVSL